MDSQLADNRAPLWDGMQLDTRKNHLISAVVVAGIMRRAGLALSFEQSEVTSRTFLTFSSRLMV